MSDETTSEPTDTGCVPNGSPIDCPEETANSTIWIAHTHAREIARSIWSVVTSYETKLNMAKAQGAENFPELVVSYVELFQMAEYHLPTEHH